MKLLHEDIMEKKCFQVRKIYKHASGKTLAIIGWHETSLKSMADEKE